MSRFSTKEELLEDALAARQKLDVLLASMPDEAKLEEITEGMTTKDFIAHRTEWGRMTLSWCAEARDGTTPAVPAEGYSWGQLKELNARIHERFVDIPLDEAQREFDSVNDELITLIGGCTEEELFTKRYYGFTGTSDLATYLTSATGGHYRSAYKHINRWWRANKEAFDTS